MTPDNIRLFLPYYLVTAGLLIAIAVIFSPLEDKAAGLGLAGSAITGAAGLAQANRD